MDLIGPSQKKVSHLQDTFFMNTTIASSRKVHHGFWPVFFGITLVLLGLVVMASASSFTFGISWIMGFAFVVSGGVQTVHAFQLLDSRGRVGRFLMAALSLIAGVVILRNPDVGAEAITLLLSFYLLFGGLTKGVVAYESGQAYGRNWLIFSSIVSAFLGVWLIVTFPSSSLIMPGTLLGVDLLFNGFSLAFFSIGYTTQYHQSEPVSLPNRFRNVS